jgi:Tol biopolymer transport system component
VDAARGSLIAFWSDRGGLPGVWLMRPDETGRRLVVGGRLRAKRADLSPDGRELVFDGQPPRGDTFAFDIQVVAVDGRGRRRLTHGPARDLWPRWSPDGRTIVFQRGGERSPQSIWTIRPDGSGARRLAAGSAPAWSPDGRTILFARAPHGIAATSQVDLFTMQADGTRVRRLTRTPDDEVPAGWSPDRRWILFTKVSRAGPAADVYVAHADLTRVRRVTAGPARHVAAAWSPDGRTILYTTIVSTAHSERGQVFVVGVDGRGPRNLSHNRFDENATSWKGGG